VQSPNQTNLWLYNNEKQIPIPEKKTIRIERHNLASQKASVWNSFAANEYQLYPGERAIDHLANMDNVLCYTATYVDVDSNTGDSDIPMATISVCLPVLALSDTYRATFNVNNTGIDGYVEVNNGQIEVMLDLSMVGELPENCTDTLKYHLHSSWDHASDDDQINSTMCGSAYTSGHWDPWRACGGASSNDYCDSECISTSSYSCSSTTFASDPYSCEIGDWSGKYGVLEPDENMTQRTDSSFYEVSGIDVFDRSVVFHCGNSGARAFCAPFIMMDTDNNATVPDQETDG
jgi:hypothetical protein